MAAGGLMDESSWARPIASSKLTGGGTFCLERWTMIIKRNR